MVVLALINMTEYYFQDNYFKEVLETVNFIEWFLNTYMPTAVNDEIKTYAVNFIEKVK